MKNNFLSPNDFEKNYKYGFDILSIANAHIVPGYANEWEFNRAAIDMADDSICHAYFSPTSSAKDKSRNMEIRCTVTPKGPEYQTIYTPCTC